MKNEKKKYTRRDVINLLGKGAVASVVGASLLGNAGNIEAKAIQTLDFVIKDYRVYIHSAPQYSWSSRIYLRSSKGKSCTIYFMKEGQNLPPNQVSSTGNSGKIYFSENKYSEIRDFLRYEKPVRLTVVGTNGIATLSNDNYEAVGDYDV